MNNAQAIETLNTIENILHAQRSIALRAFQAIIGDHSPVQTDGDLIRLDELKDEARMAAIDLEPWLSPADVCDLADIVRIPVDNMLVGFDDMRINYAEITDGQAVEPRFVQGAESVAMGLAQLSHYLRVDIPAMKDRLTAA